MGPHILGMTDIKMVERKGRNREKGKEEGGGGQDWDVGGGKWEGRGKEGEKERGWKKKKSGHFLCTLLRQFILGVGEINFWG